MKTLSIKQENSTLYISGICDKKSLALLKKDFVFDAEFEHIIFDFSSLKSIDTAGICFFLALEHKLKLNNQNVEKKGLNAKNAQLFAFCEKYYQANPFYPQEKNLNFFVWLGEKIICNLEVLKAFISFSGAVFLAFLHCLLKPRNFRFLSFFYHIEQSALKALGIIILCSLLVGVVLAYQAAYQLAQFGANIFIVDLVGISATREIAPLIAAIIIAGRSGSAYTAQIGVMKITDEINAMNTMGFDSPRFIVLPRVLALSVAMPFVVVVADAVSIFGGMLIADLNLGINYFEFLRRFKEVVALKHILIGIIKAPMFGFLIALIACFRAFEVKNTTESIGIYTTKSVVNAIFWVIAFDAIFSIFLTRAGI